MRYTLIAALSISLATACGGTSDPQDAGGDVAIDSRLGGGDVVDTHVVGGDALDVSPEAGNDVATGIDSPNDTGVDVGFDVSSDADHDAGLDVPTARDVSTADTSFDTNRADVTDVTRADTGSCSLYTCGSACVDLATDRNNCGMCGNACPPGNACAGGYCGPVCLACFCIRGLTKCSGHCIDTSTHQFNCGACGVVCAPGQTCSRGTCI